MAADRPRNPATDRAMQVLRGLQQVQDESIVVPGSTPDRLVARLIDGAILFLLGAIVLVIHSVLTSSTPEIRSSSPVAGEREFLVAWGPRSLTATLLLGWLAAVALAVVYEAGSTRLWGATPGKRSTQLQIVRSDNLEPASGARVALRMSVLAAPGAFAILTAFYSLLFCWGAVAVLAAMYLWRYRQDSGGRPFWDVVAATRVVGRERLR